MLGAAAAVHQHAVQCRYHVLTCSRIVLKEDVVQSTKLEHAIWVIHPTKLRSDMKLGMLRHCLLSCKHDAQIGLGVHHLSQHPAISYRKCNAEPMHKAHQLSIHMLNKAR